jgi:phosphoserine phosphatase RsbU/P
VSSLNPDATRLQQLRRLTEVSRALTQAVSLEQILDLTVRRAAELLDAGKVVLMLANDDSLLSVRATHGVAHGLADRFAEPLSESLIARIKGLFGDDCGGFLGVPLVVDGKVSGILAVASVASTRPVEEHEWLLSALADQAAVALEKTRLSEVAEFRERLLAIVGHDLRNPLNAISMSADVLRQSDAPERFRTRAERIMESCNRMRSMIDQLADFTRARLGGGIPLERETFDLVELCRSIIAEANLSHPGVDIRFTAEPTTGTWDRDRLAQVISNLIGNALQHGAGAAVTVSLYATTDTARLDVHNLGKPIPPDLLRHLFDPFRTSSTNGVHLGLGLYIVQQIIHAHDGTIAVTSNGEGTRFSVQLPRHR